MELTDPQILDAIDHYRATVGGRHGPLSLEHLRVFSRFKYGRTISKSAFHVRIRKLVDNGYLVTTKDWTCKACHTVNPDAQSIACWNCNTIFETVKVRLHTASLALTESAKQLLAKERDGLLEKA